MADSEKGLRWKIAQWAEIRWWKNYLQKKAKPDYLRWKKEYWNSLLTETGIRHSLVKNSRILDIGCGPSGVFMVLPNDTKVTALDPLIDTYINDLKLFDPNDFPFVTFINKPFEDFHFESKYDHVFCLNVINHVDNIELSFDRLAESIATNGQLLISIDAHNYSWLKKIFRLFPGDILHPHQLDLQEYLTHLTSRGMKIDKKIRKDKGLIFDYWVIVATKLND